MDGLLGFGGIVRRIDPTYVDDFWTKPGYLGTEQSPLGDVVRAALADVGDTPDNRWDIALRTYYRHQVPAASDGYYGFDQLSNPNGAPEVPAAADAGRTAGVRQRERRRGIQRSDQRKDDQIDDLLRRRRPALARRLVRRSALQSGTG